ncbi:MAG: SUMF1/EgtB/PvdO family nonheme iron enzyme, partial [bacterium]|nr:SUMF1/EgtB/PvdO family nonheme iron enzyme [bacterium]
VRAGCFTMGSTDEQLDDAVALGGQRDRYVDEQPVHEQCFDAPFWIDRTEVTRAMYAACVADGGCTETPVSDYSSRDTQPIDRVTWFQAREFCAWRGVRLPTEAEWEYAARGPDGLVYPWGDEFVRVNATNEGNSGGETADVGSRPWGVSWVGAFDMSGNVWEWVSTLYEGYPYNAGDGREDMNDTDSDRVLRGGSFDDGDWILGATNRNWRYPAREFIGSGFRCARADGRAAAAPPAESATPAPDSTTVVTANADWTPVVAERDGVEMVLVPAGCFMMGSTDEQIEYAAYLEGQREWFADEQPVHEQCFEEPFWIDRYEVTNAQFDAFGGAAGLDSYRTDPNRPREQITWFEARDFCALRGARLPTEAEWEYAARGPDSLVFPWGNDFVADNVVYEGNSLYNTADVGSKPGGMSWVGAYDLSGNVWELVSTLYEAYPYHADDGREGVPDDTDERVLRGGSFVLVGDDLRAASRSSGSPDGGSVDVGFRCARGIGDPEVTAFVTALIESSPGKRGRIQRALTRMPARA